MAKSVEYFIGFYLFADDFPPLSLQLKESFYNWKKVKMMQKACCSSGKLLTVCFPLFEEIFKIIVPVVGFCFGKWAFLYMLLGQASSKK